MSLSNSIHKLIEQYLGSKLHNQHNIISHYRHGSTIFTSELFGEGKCRHSSSCIFGHTNGNVACGRIILFEKHHEIAVVKPYIPASGKLLDDIHLPNDPNFLQVCKRLSCLQDHQYTITSLYSKPVVLPITNILLSCAYIKLPRTNCVITVPNHYEFH